MIYKLVKSTKNNDLGMFEKLVNEHIEDGWIPLGGVCAIIEKYDCRTNARNALSEFQPEKVRLIQSMTKKKQKVIG
jgi:hypothetical protein